MMKKKLILALPVILIYFANPVLSQNFGWMGKKNIVSLFTTSNMRVAPLVRGLISSGFYSENYGYNYRTDTYDSQNNYKSKLDLFRVDFRVSYQRILSKSFALGLEFGYGKTTARLWGKNFIYYDSQNQLIDPLEDVSDPIFRTYSYLITLEFYKSSSIQGGGFSWSGGVGPKFYSFVYDENYRFSTDFEMQNPYPASESNLVSINFFHQLSYRFSLVKNLFLEIGVRIHSGFMIYDKKAYLSTDTPSDFDWDKKDMYNGLARDNSFNLASIKTGLVIEF